MTRLFGVIGYPIGHSLSPAMHAAALRALKLDALYTAIEVPPRFLSPILRALILSGVEGLNVTIPLKESVVQLMDRVDETAQAVGAVNTIVIRDRRAIGCNTDGIGFRRALSELGWRPGPGRTVLLGAGGAARAVAWELAHAARTDLTIANRHVDRAERLAQWLKRRVPRVRVQAVPLRRVALDSVSLLVNATSVGMRASDPLLIDPRALRRGLVVYDLVYHRTTELVQAARRRGCVAASGLSMLLYQGAESLRLWLRRRPPLAPMRAALERALRHTTKGSPELL